MIGIIVVSVIAYLIGSISFSVIFTKKFAGFDVREKGSKSAGSTNVLRTAGKGPAILTFICDVLKGVVAVSLAIAIGLMIKADWNTRITMVQCAGIFRGGKGVATALGVLLIVNWRIALICLIFALILMVVSRMVSLGSISAAILFPILCIFIKQNFIISGSHMSYIVFGIIMALIVIFNHRSNIKRIAKGEENRLGSKKNK